MGTAGRDGNYVTTLLGVSSSDGTTPITVYADPITHRLLIDASGSSNFADDETPTGAIDDVNVTFTLAHTPSPAASLQLFLNGALQQPGGGDYTLATATITFNSAPLTGSILIAWYRY